MSRTRTERWSELIPFDQWIAWIIGGVSFAVTITVFIYVNFLTKVEFDEYKRTDLRYEEALEKRLDRIESKLDQILSRLK